MAPPRRYRPRLGGEPRGLGCCLEVFKYWASKKHSFGTPGPCFYCFFSINQTRRTMLFFRIFLVAKLLFLNSV